jgi:hypothetical protein
MDIQKQNEVMKEFIKDLMWGIGGEWCDQIDGGDLQEHAEKLGLIEKTTVTEPCCENCACADVWDEFPVECYRYVKWMQHDPVFYQGVEVEFTGEQHGTG